MFMSSLSRTPSLFFGVALLAVCLLFPRVTRAGEGEDVVAAPEVSGTRARLNNLSEVGLSETSFDLNKDGAADQRHLSRAGLLVRVERDFNFDGRTDTYEHYEDARLVEEEMDLDFDGKIDVVRQYRGEHLDRKQYAIDFASQMAITLHYDKDGQLASIERDTDDDQRVDTWERYRPGAKTPYRVEVDLDGDGVADRETQLEERPDIPPPPETDR